MSRETIAKLAHEINRAYCLCFGDDSQPQWDDAPDWQKASALAGVDMHLANPDATPEQSHESWLAQKVADGWVYGETKDPEKKEHPCCVPYADLPQAQKAKDYLFRQSVHSLSKILSDYDEKIQDLERQIAAAEELLESSGQKEHRFDVPVRYIGRRETFTDTLYGSNLVFTKGQVRSLPGELASRFLRHSDLFERTKAEKIRETKSQANEVEAAAARVNAMNKERFREQNEISDMISQIEMMGKASISDFALKNFRHTFKPTVKLKDMRQETIQMIHRFGII